ncbi:MAG: hypothetical protein M0P31_16815 [Solirubrobacteraceae bacterium]|nr:hypothetical protein [Solirubrobacteraceae bacterium]
MSGPAAGWGSAREPAPGVVPIDPVLDVLRELAPVPAALEAPTSCGPARIDVGP